MNRATKSPLTAGLRLGAIVIVAALGLAACGSSSSGGSTVASAAKSALAKAAAHATALSTPAATGSTPASSVPAGATAGSFCGYAKKAQSQSASEIQAFESDSPAQLSAFIQRALAELQSYTSTAPAAIKADVAVAVAADEKVFQALKNANYDYRKLSPSEFVGVDTPQVKKASNAIVAYLAHSCGITPNTAPTG